MHSTTAAMAMTLQMVSPAVETFPVCRFRLEP